MTALKRDIITIIILILLIIVYVGYHTYDVKKDMEYYPELNEVDMTHISLYDYIHPEITYVCMNMGTEYKGDYYVKYQDDVEELFDRFDVPFEYRDYTRQLCELQNVDPIVFISLVQIESHWGVSDHGVTSDFNKEVKYRMYGPNKEWADLGLGQLSTRWESMFRERHFNPELIRSLGYVRKWDIRDPYVNLQVAASYLSFLYKYFGDYELAVQSYNTGMGNVINGKVPKITYEYTHAIMNSWKFREKHS